MVISLFLNLKTMQYKIEKENEKIDILIAELRGKGFTVSKNVDTILTCSGSDFTIAQNMAKQYGMLFIPSIKDNTYIFY